MSQLLPNPVASAAVAPSSDQAVVSVARAAGATGTTQVAARHQSTPEALADVALIDAPACAAVGAMSVSWWHAQVAAGRAPAPVIRAPRCTRWRLADVRAFWLAFGSAADSSAAEAVKAQASKASAAATNKRRQAAASLQVRA